MWIPKSAAEIEEAVKSGTLLESPTFDAKASIGSSKEVAKDIAAMATDGGVLLYGVGEDEQKRLTKLTPVTLKGGRERIDQIALSALAEPLSCQIHMFESSADLSVGYIAVIVPLSARAPHQVTVDKDFRFYGRTETGNRVLTEGEIARLYARRRRWEQDTDMALKEVVNRAPIAPHEKSGYLHLFCRPVAQDDGFFERAVDRYREMPSVFIEDCISSAIGARPLRSRSDINFSRGVQMFQVVTGWIVHFGARPGSANRNDPFEVLDLKINYDGSGELFSGGAAFIQRRDRFVLEERKIADFLTQFLLCLGNLYEKAGYVGHVDLGVAITGIEGAESSSRLDAARHFASDIDTYLRTARVPAIELPSNSIDIGRSLLKRLIDSMTQGNNYDPFDV